MKDNVLKAVKRDVKSKGALSDFRKKGMVPAVLYGHGTKPVTMAVDAKAFEKLLQAAGKNALITLEIEGSQENAVVKDIQKDTIRRNPIHIDFLRIVMTEKIEVSVPIHVVGEAPGVKLHEGILEHLLRAVKVRCLPSSIPQSIDVDVSSLEIGESITVGNLKKMEGVEILTDPAQIVVNVVPPAAEEEVAAVPGAVAPGATGAEPEVIAKGKKEEEGLEGAVEGKDAKKGAPAGDAKKGAPAAKPAEAGKGEAKKPEAKK